VSNPKSYQYEELRLAVDQLRLRHPLQPWLIPIRLTRWRHPGSQRGFGASDHLARRPR
jgi:hypothetical protein